MVAWSKVSNAAERSSTTRQRFIAILPSTEVVRNYLIGRYSLGICYNYTHVFNIS